MDKTLLPGYGLRDFSSKKNGQVGLSRRRLVARSLAAVVVECAQILRFRGTDLAIT
jgi:hypothetical protein